jgi:NADPH-dependent glutamate synthase beta subunit-like oxidoreductase/NAD(P)H-flavin reductase
LLDLTFAGGPVKKLDLSELYDDTGPALSQIDECFLNFLGAENPLLGDLLSARTGNNSRDSSGDSELLISLARELEDFLRQAFTLPANQDLFSGNANLLKLKWKFVKRKGVLLHSIDSLSDFDWLKESRALEELMSRLPVLIEKNSRQAFTDQCFGQSVLLWQQQKTPQAEFALQAAARYAAWAAQTEQGQARHFDSSIFSLPQDSAASHWQSQLQINEKALTEPQPSAFHIKPMFFHPRKGFNLTEPHLPVAQAHLQASAQADYCLKCHKTKTDSCSSGKETDRKGCPLHEKISEFLSLRNEGASIAALAMIVRDNPMLAATGHRICNDCSLACVFQNQSPVDIPKTETQVLSEILLLPYGFEIYSLLTRWNPLNFEIWKPLAKSNKTVLVAGMGPAGFTLAHHLMQRGHDVVGIDGLKLLPMRSELNRKISSCEPIKDISDWFEPLESRPAYGFGGVAEYGITSRWDKNFLTVIRLLLARRKGFAALGDIRLGSSLSIGQAFNWGFSHVACALGAGAPKLPELNFKTQNILPKGVKTASDFLMALHSCGARKMQTNTNLQIRMPVVVVGGGLTGVDAATEALAYYPLQVTRYHDEFIALNADSKTDFLNELSPQDLQIHEEYLAHAARFANTTQNLVTDALGGSTLIYRKSLLQSPAYDLNRDELRKALAEGISFVENVNPVGYTLDEFGAVAGVRVVSGTSESVIPAKTVLYAIGTLPNDLIFTEETGSALVFDNLADKGFLVGKTSSGKSVSRVGDLHPAYAGSVVKAMASAKAAAPVIDAELSRLPQSPIASFADLVARLQTQHMATVQRIVHHSPGIAEIFLHSPAAASLFKPGQFFRLQSLSDDSVEPLAMTGASVNAETGEISMVVLAMGASSIRASQWPVGERVSLMGPTGVPTEIPRQKKVVLVGGGLGNAVLFSIGKAMQENGCEVVYFAAYKNQSDIFSPERVQGAAQTVVWCCESQRPASTRPGDYAVKGNVVEALRQQQDLLKDASHILVIGSDRMMAALAKVRKDGSIRHLSAIAKAVASINSPMQCMMKAICGQCLQASIDRSTGQIHYVFSCLQQDQLLDQVDFHSLGERLGQNRLFESLSLRRITQAND